jgi:2-dehydro-3-deoxyphosphooctonate aldolase (KDO 8-P synthase)
LKLSAPARPILKIVSKSGLYPYNRKLHPEFQKKRNAVLTFATDFLFDRRRPFLIAGPCALESEKLALEVGETVKRLAKKLGVPYIFKSSFDKANRSSGSSYRGPGLEAGLASLAKVRAKLGVPVITDVHESSQVARVAAVADVLQVPAFLCRQTDLLLACARTGKPVVVKKGQFVAPPNMSEAVKKIQGAGNKKVLLAERGATFGYNNLVVDFTGLPQMRAMGVPVVFDATHSVQLPGGLGHASGGRREYVESLACAAAAVGVDGYFFEVHPRPDKALSDGPNMVALKDFPRVLKRVLAHDALTRKALKK